MFVVSTIRICSVICIDLKGFYSVCGLVIMSSTPACFLDYTKIWFTCLNKVQDILQEKLLFLHLSYISLSVPLIWIWCLLYINMCWRGYSVNVLIPKKCWTGTSIFRDCLCCVCTLTFSSLYAHPHMFCILRFI